MWFKKKTKKSKFITWTEVTAPIPEILVNTDDIKMVIHCAHPFNTPAHLLPEYRVYEFNRPYRIFFRDGRYLDITHVNYDKIKAALCQI